MINLNEQNFLPYEIMYSITSLFDSHNGQTKNITRNTISFDNIHFD